MRAEAIFWKYVTDPDEACDVSAGTDVADEDCRIVASVAGELADKPTATPGLRF